MFDSATCLTMRCSASSRHAILMRYAFLASLVTARQRQLAWSTLVRIIVSIAALTAPTDVLSLSSLDTLEVSMMQYRVSVIVEGVVPMDDMETTFAGELLGGVRATSAYDGFGLAYAVALMAELLVMVSSR